WTLCLAAVGLFATTAVLGYSQRVLVLVLVLAPLLALDPALAILAAAFNARAQLVYVALFQVAQSLVYGTLAVLVITTSLGVTGLAFSTVTAALCAAVLGLVVLRVNLGLRLHLNQPRRKAWSFLRAAIPIAGVGFVGVIYDRVDIVMLSVLSNASSVAHYTVPFGFVRLSWIVPSVVSAAFFPLLSRKVDSRSSDAEYLFFLVVRVFLFLSLPISLILALSSPTLLPFVFGHHYTQSVPVLQIMAWTSVFGFQNYILWYGALASRQERAVLGVQVGGLVVNVCVNAFAIPMYGASGAATALVVSDLVVVAGQTFLIHRNLFRVPFFELLAKPVAAGAVVIPIAVLVATRTAVGGALIGAAAYVTILLVLQYVTLAEWKPLAVIVRAPFTRLKWGRPRST
ncbi:MAG: polysaccharide biosynthesis C-terminal domain-containing protein, partial [Actinomycetota bacterium]|nr:polysaccharide biosynthesis C-terminal domain-containing protein [Actinomycetota bacterium]